MVKRTIKVITTSQVTEQVLTPMLHQYTGGMITEELKLDLIRVKLGKNMALQPGMKDIVDWTTSADMVISLIDVPNEESIYIAEYLRNHMPSYNIIHSALVLFSKKMSDITWKYWRETYLPRYFQSVDFALLVAERFDPVNLISSVERCFQALMFTLKGLDLTLLVSGLVNLDAADMHAITRDGAIGVVSMGFGLGENAGRDAVKDAISRIPTEFFSLDAVTGAVINVIGGGGMNIKLAASVADEIKRALSPSARIIWGATIDERMGRKVKIGLGLGVPLKFIRVPG